MTRTSEAPVWASFEAWRIANRIFHSDREDWAHQGWNACQPEIDALKAENQALREAYAVLKEAAQAVWDAKSQSGDAIAAWTRLIDVLEGSVEQINQDA